MPDIKAIQSEMRATKIDGWLFFDHHHRDPIAARVLGLSTNGLVSRRWFYFIPAKGEPRKYASLEEGLYAMNDERPYPPSARAGIHYH